MKMDAVVSAASATIVVIGGGLAGLSASLEAVRHAAACHAALRVLVLEKSPALGGNSAKASSGLSALTAASNDTEALFLSDTIRSGGGLSNESLVRKLVVRAACGRARFELPARLAAVRERGALILALVPHARSPRARSTRARTRLPSSRDLASTCLS